MRRVICSGFFAAMSLAADIRWVHLSSEKGAIPNPGGSNQQTGLLVAELDKQRAADLVISYRVTAPALVWIRREAGAWKRYVIEPEFFKLEAGGASYDIDGDGDNDIVFGGDGQDRNLWWWENPHPNFSAGTAWKRHVIKNSGANQHHDQAFGDFTGAGRPQLAFWNQKAKTLFIAPIPANPRGDNEWPRDTIFAGQAGEQVENAAAYAEGAQAFDVDGDGQQDLLAGNSWFKHIGGGKFQTIRVGTIGGRIQAGRFQRGKLAQIVIAPGDGSGPLRFYDCNGNPAESTCWKGRDLLDRPMTHGHTLDTGDIDGDGNLDIFAAEMAKWTRGDNVDHPGAAAWILYGDGKGGFRKTELVTGHGWHEGKLADVDGDGDLDVVNKPYTWNAPRLDLWLNNGTRAPGKAAFRKPVAMELYTYRDLARKDLPGTLAMIRKLGFKDIETANFYGRTAAGFRAELTKAGLTCSSYITGYARLAEQMDAVIAEAKTIGAKYVLTAGIPRKGLLTEEITRKAAADFNNWGARLKAAGLQFGYHPHGFEFVPAEGGNLFDILLAETKPDLVTYEMDIFWFVIGGADPAYYLRRHPTRFALMHLKDLEPGYPTGGHTGNAPDETSVAVGSGALDMPAILSAAEKAGVRHYYIEDEHPHAAEQVPATLRYLKEVRLP
jgi:sugar phosphate isomerase/epimerase